MQWSGTTALVTGGASFIGSHLTEALLQRGAEVRVVDDLSSGRLENLRPHLDEGSVEFIQGDLHVESVRRQAVAGVDVVFHLAADHGGRGYVELHQAACATNLAMDGAVLLACRDADVERVVFASSGCVYPNFIQQDPTQELYLTEEMVGPPYDADNMYGWAKLMGELTLQAYHDEYGLGAASCRYFTVYGPRAKENHAVMAMTARAFVGQDPFEVWGDGTQVRNWTHVDDIVEGTILAAEKVDDGTAINLGTMERIRVIDAVQMVLEMTGHQANIRFLPDMPTGPINRVADNSLAKKLLGWEPKVPFRQGLERTIKWYYATKGRDEVQRILDGGGFIARKVATSPSD
ncbi:MAG: NAD-dependent epimerase/dehydratase family protein [Planctomycetes bacterium]|nr:NAD-dependent epimerase/dehydratase family protein [Planctomycetota bacterium]